jgi:hypothetical protein
MGKADSGLKNGDDDMPSLEDFDHNDGTDDDADSGNLFEDRDKEDNDDDKFEKLSEEEHSRLLDDTSAVCETVSKVRVHFKVYFHLSDIGDIFFHSFNNFHLQLFIQQLLPSQHGDNSARSMNLN